MKNHLELSDEQFEQQFANCLIAPALFTHEAHLRLAWIHIKAYGIDKAVENITQQLKQYVEVVGAKDKYNETVTIAAVLAVYHFILRSNTTNFSSFIKENEQLVKNFKGLLLSHYSTNIFESEVAKKKFIEPELAPFD